MDYISAGKKAWQTRLAKKAALASEANFNQVKAPEVKPTLNAEKSTPATNKYVYDKSSDTYTTYLKSENGLVSISGEIHRAMHKSYSDWAGKEATIQDMAQEFDRSVPWVTEYKNVHGWTHSQGPFTPEEIETKPIETLVTEAIQYKKKDWQSEYERKAAKETKEAADKWNNYERSVLSYIDRVFANKPAYYVDKLSIGQAEEPYALVLPVMDLHYGRGSWRIETGEEYSRSECTKLLKYHTNKVLDRVVKIGAPDKIITCCGSDWLHIDNSQGTTTKGTPQDLDGTPGLILKEGMELAVEHIDMLRQIAPVEIVMAAGNHDEFSSIAILMFIAAWFRDCDDVTVNLSLKPRNHVVYANNLIVFSHGDESKVSDICKLIPHEYRNIWSQVDNTILFTGHRHYEQSTEDNGISTFQVGSLSGADIWHAKKGYVLARKALSGYIIFEGEGYGGQITSSMSNNEKFGFKTNHYSKKRY